MEAPKTQNQADVAANPLAVRSREAARLLGISERLMWEWTRSEGPMATRRGANYPRFPPEERWFERAAARNATRFPRWSPRHSREAPSALQADRSRDSPRGWPNSRGRPFWRSSDAGRSGSRLKDRSVTNHAGWRRKKHGSTDRASHTRRRDRRDGRSVFTSSRSGESR
jgi:hypothetical protein